MLKISELKTWEESINQILNGDCLDLMKMMPDECVDLVLTDPPYGVGKAEWDKSFNNSWIKECSRICKDDSTLISFCGTKQSPYLAIEIDKFFDERQRLIWYCPNKNFYSPRHLIIKTEESHIGRRGRPYFNNDRNSLDLMTVNKETELLGHPCQKPKKLFEKILLIYSDENALIFDPFMGSWTTARACKNLHRNFIGCELSKKYCKIGENRLKQQNLF